MARNTARAIARVQFDGGKLSGMRDRLAQPYTGIAATARAIVDLERYYTMVAATLAPMAIPEDIARGLIWGLRNEVIARGVNIRLALVNSLPDIERAWIRACVMCELIAIVDATERYTVSFPAPESPSDITIDQLIAIGLVAPSAGTGVDNESA